MKWRCQSIEKDVLRLSSKSGTRLKIKTQQRNRQKNSQPNSQKQEEEKAPRTEIA
jgi:hypothetical protein